jgi:hypothetical protein
VHGDEWHGDSTSWRHDISLLLLCLLLLMLHVYEGCHPALQRIEVAGCWQRYCTLMLN